MNVESLASRLDWEHMQAQLNAEGYAVLPRFLSRSVVRDLADLGREQQRTSLASEKLGHGELCYLPRNLPPVLRDLRDCFYRRLVPVANRWNEIFGTGTSYPAELSALLARNRRAGQTHAQSNVTFLRQGDYQALHQRAGDSQVFPFQLIALLSDPFCEFMGGEFVMVEQRPRMQSRPMVLALELADVAIIATAGRPQKGAKGHYRVNLRHAISRIHKGERVGLEIFLHDSAESRAM